MSPVTFHCSDFVQQSPQQIAAQILDLSRWPDFTGYGPLPGIRSAAFEAHPPEIVGTRIRVTNTDGSTHVEEITIWRPDTTVQLRMQEFVPPLSHLATYFVETWEFSPDGSRTHVTRSFELYAKTWWAKPVLKLIAPLLKRAIARHLRLLRGVAG